MLRPLPRSTLFPYTTLFRSSRIMDVDRCRIEAVDDGRQGAVSHAPADDLHGILVRRKRYRRDGHHRLARDRKSTRLNSSHSQISYAVFCLKKKISTSRARTS